MTFQGFACRLTCPRIQGKGRTSRSNGIICEGNSLANFKASVGGGVACWNFPDMEVLVSTTVARSLSLASRDSQDGDTALLKWVGECGLHRGYPLIAWPRWSEGLVFVDARL